MKTPLTSEQIIAKHAPSAQARARLELQLVEKLIACAEAANWRLEVHSDESLEAGDVRSTLFNLDEATVVLIDENNEKRGWVFLVFGNGSELISDYSVNLEEFLEPVIEMADAMPPAQFLRISEPNPGEENETTSLQR